jgi:hypothetical protein
VSVSALDLFSYIMGDLGILLNGQWLDRATVTGMADISALIQRNSPNTVVRARHTPFSTHHPQWEGMPE